MPPTDRLQAARQTYAEIAEASRRSLGEKAAALEKAVTTTAESVAAMRREVAQLHTDLDRGRDRVRDTVHQVSADADALRRAIRLPWTWMFVIVIVGAFAGTFLSHLGRLAAAALWEVLAR